MIKMNARVLLLGLCFTGLLTAQTDVGRLTGIVTDSRGAAVRGAVIKVTSEKTGDVRQAISSENGQYAVPQLAPTTYSVSASAPGLGPTEFKGVIVGVGQERPLDISIAPTAVVTQVNVSGGDLASIDTSSARIGVNVSEREVKELPLNGRQISQLYLLTPGAVNNGSGTFDDIRFSGRANEQNIIRFDGIEGTSIIDSSPGNLNGEQSSFFRLQASLENVQEFRVDSNNYPAEYGTGTGGQISIITKSGGNAYHGSVFEYVRNNYFDARDFFNNRQQLQAPLRLNQFGGSVGGALIQNKLFFFGSYEGMRQRQGATLVEGTLSRSARTRAVASIQPLLAAYPLGNVATANPDIDLVSQLVNTRIDEDAGNFRLDYKLNDEHTFYVRYFRSQGTALAPYDVTGSALQTTAVPQNAILNWNWIINPTTINEFKFGVNAAKTRYNGIAPVIPGVDLSAVAIQLSGSVAISGISGQGGSAGLATATGLNRANSASNGRGQPYTNYSVSFIDSVSKISGAHNFKAGIEFRPIRIFTDRLGGTTYTYNNVNDFLANNLASVQVLGDLSAPNPFDNGHPGVREGIQYYTAAYAQDEFRIRPNVTINYGIRYEYYTVMRERLDRTAIFDMNTGTLKPEDSSWYHTSPNNFGPRVGLSWSPQRFGSKTVLRMGAGYYYGPGQEEDQIQPLESARASRTISGVQAGGSAVYPVNPQSIISGFDLNNPTLGFQPRAYAPGYIVPEKILQYTASIEQQLPGNSVLTVAYVGSQGRNLFLRGVTNRIVSVDTNPVTGAAIVTREFGPKFAEIDYKTSHGADHYNALQASFNRRYARGLTVGSQYTWAHSIGNSDGSNEARTSSNNYSFGSEYGDNNFDVRQSFNVSTLYELPFGKGSHYSSMLLGGWQVGGMFNARTGVPIEVGITRPDVVYQDTRNGAIYTSPLVQSGAVLTKAIINVPGGGASRNIRRPDYVQGVSPYLVTSSGFFINPAAFSVPAPGTYGNLARNALHGPEMSQLDLTLDKKFRLTEHANIEFRTEVFNLLNRPNFKNPASSLAQVLPGAPGAANTLQPGQPYSPGTAGGTFGKLTSTVSQYIGQGTNRQIQLSLRVNF